MQVLLHHTYASIFKLLSVTFAIHQLSILVYCFDEDAGFAFSFRCLLLDPDLFKGGAKMDLLCVLLEALMLLLERRTMLLKMCGKRLI